MAYGPLLPPDHHYAGYLKAKWYSFDPTTGEFIVDKAALEPRVSADGTEEKELSGNHVEWFQQATKLDKIRALHNHLTTVVRLNLKPNGAFGIVSADAIVTAAATTGVRVEVREDPTPADATHGADDSHAVIIGIRLADALAQAAIALKTELVKISTL